MDSNELLKYYRVFKKLLQMLIDRGYDVNEEQFNMDFNEFCVQYGASFLKGSSLYSEKFNFMVTHKKNPKQKLLILFPKDPKVKINTVLDSFKKMDQLEIFEAIIVFEESITAFAENTFRLDILKDKNDPTKPKIKTNFKKFSIAQLLGYNPRNKNIPQHRKLPEEEKIKLLKENNWELKNLPKLSETDIASEYGDFREGDVIEIKDQGSNGKSIKWKTVGL